MTMPSSKEVSQSYQNAMNTLENISDNIYDNCKCMLKKIPCYLSSSCSCLQNSFYNNPLIFFCFILPLILLSLPAIVTFLVFASVAVSIGCISFLVIEGFILFIAGSVLLLALAGVGAFVLFAGSIGFVVLVGTKWTTSLLLRWSRGEPLLSEDIKESVWNLKGTVQRKANETIGASFGTPATAGNISANVPSTPTSLPTGSGTGASGLNAGLPEPDESRAFGSVPSQEPQETWNYPQRVRLAQPPR